MKVRAENNEIESRKTLEKKISVTKSQFFEKIHKVDKLARMTKKKRHKLNIRNEPKAINTDSLKQQKCNKELLQTTLHT